MSYINERPPKDNILKKLIEYLFFNFIITISPVLINIFISFTNQIQYKSTILYCPDICFMTIVTSSSSIRDVYAHRTTRKNNFISGGLIIFNVTLMILSMIIYANIAKDNLSQNTLSNITVQQFTLSVIFYALSVILGLGIHIGGGIN